jgi:hypothetical protein
MLTIVAFVTKDTENLISKLQEAFQYSEIELILYMETDAMRFDDHIKVVQVGGFKYPQTSVLLELDPNLEETLFIFDIQNFLQKKQSSVLITSKNIKPDLDVESIYDDCFNLNQPMEECLKNFLTTCVQ